MQVYSVMLEGADSSGGYFLNIEVASATRRQAAAVARQKAGELGLRITGVEIVLTDRTQITDGPQVLLVSGRSYFP
jgi:hypothetical protein